MNCSIAAISFPVRRNTFLLSACLVVLSGVLQLAVAVATITLVLVTGIESILGLGPAIFITAGALAALPAGRLMDRVGRVPVIAGGFAIGAAGCALTAVGCAVDSSVPVVLGFVGVGAMNGAVLLARTAAADMYPPERRARAISYVLFGALFGAALGPLVFRPLFAGKDLELDTLVIPWFAAAAIALVGVLLALTIRPDPRTIPWPGGAGASAVTRSDARLADSSLRAWCSRAEERPPQPHPPSCSALASSDGRRGVRRNVRTWRAHFRILSSTRRWARLAGRR